MRRYNYTARDTTINKDVKAVIQADSEKGAAKVLMEQGLMHLTITEESQGGLLKSFTQRITSKDKVNFTRQLATLIEAGLPLSQSLHTISEQIDNPKMRRVVDDIIASIESGRPLGDSFAKHPDVFDRVYIALVRAGELSGTLDKALKRIADQQEKDAELMRKVKGALYYPAIVMIVIVAVVVFMVVTIVPQVEKLYAGLGQQLPALTAALIWLSNFLVDFWWLTIIVMGILVYFFIQYLKTDSGIRVSDNLKLNAPLVKDLMRKLYMARFTRTGQTLLATGVPMLDMLSITAEAVNNTYVSESIENAADKVKGGKPLSKSIEVEDYVLPLVPQMISIGERAGQIDTMMGKVAKVYEDEVEEQIKAISTIIEPILMVVMAIFAGGIVMAILFPIYSLVSLTNGQL